MNLRKTSRRRGALNKCWKGYKIAKSEFDTNNMFHYAKGISRLQRELKISVSDFPQFGLVGRITTVEEEEEQNSPGLGYTQTQNEFENHELQEQDPFSEPDFNAVPNGDAAYKCKIPL